MEMIKMKMSTHPRLLMEWSELISENRKKLSYLSSSLDVKEEDVSEKFIKEYPELLDERSRSRLNKRALE